MRQNSYNVVLFVLLAGATTALWWYADRNWFPKADRPKDTPAAEKTAPPERPTPEAVAAVTGVPVGLPAPPPPPKPEAPPTPPPPPAEPPTFIALGDNTWNNQVLLSTEGGGIQQIVLPKFNESDRLGTLATVDGKAAPLALVPGVVRPRGAKLREPYVPPDLRPGKVTDPATLGRLALPAYTIFQYPSADDKYPAVALGVTRWAVAAESRPADGPHSVTFQTDLPDPYFLRIRKTYTLGRGDYHVGLKVEFERLPGGQKGKGVFRYQLSGPRGEPVEGEWYTSTTRTCLIGWETPKGVARRQYEDAASITNWRGGERVLQGENTFKYAAIATQFFTSALAIDESSPGAAGKRWEYVRGTSELPFLPSDEQMKKWEEEAKDQGNPVVAAAAAAPLAAARDLLVRKMPELDDITFRAIAEPLDLAPGETATHTYAVYNGPTKVALLKYLEGDRAVDPALVDRYLNAFGLRTLTDYHSPTWIGRFANAIYWSDLVITFTNLMHGLLWAIHSAIGSWGFSIIVLTVMVRLLLFFPSRKQTAMNMKMVEVQKRLKPELDKLHEKYKDDFQTYNREKTKLMLQHGLNPFAAMGGCLLLFAQTPIFMGLYFCLQESVFFRLEPFLWVQNLAAPDMTVWWGEGVPFISEPDARHGSLAFLYLGPFLNVLPLIAVGLMLYQQNKMMPPPTDEQMAAQQRMMKIMMGVMAIMFYKVAAGLALYFIVSTAWGIIERQFIPKPKIKDGGPGGLGAKLFPKDGAPNGQAGPGKPPGRIGRFVEKMKERLEEAQKQAAEQASRQIKNPDRPEPFRRPDRPDGSPPPDRRDRDRKKKRRK